MPDADLFDQPKPPRIWTPGGESPKPVVFLRELVLLESLAPGAAKVLRRVPFRAGLNIIWADPKTAEAKAGGTRWAGHSAGKTTLCRILRWLLGEGHFAPPKLEATIAVALKDGWAVLALELDGQPWLVGRRFFHKDDYCAVAGLTMDELFAQGWPDPAPVDEFLAELDRLTVGRLEQRRFPGRDQDIRWTSLLAWLARDQETALVDVTSWRSSVKTPGERGPTDAERHVLLRLVLEILNDAENKEMVRSEGWKKDRKDFSDTRASLADRLEQACLRLSLLVPSDGKPLAGGLVLGPAKKAVEDKAGRLERMRGAVNEDHAAAAERIYRQAHAALAEGKRDVRAAERVLQAKKEHYDSRSNALLEAEKQLKQVALKPPPGICAVPRDEAKANGCPIFREQPEDFDLAALLSRFTSDREGALAEWQRANEEVETCEKELPVLTQNAEELRLRAEQARAERDAQLAEAAKLEAELQTQQPLLAAAEAAYSELVACDAKIDELSRDLSASRKRQREIREVHLPTRLAFSGCYADVLCFLLGPSTGGHVEFGEEGELVLDAWSRSAISSGAIDALAVVAFDLAAMLWSVLGKGKHPRLVIHDSPKVADMAPALYSPLFDLAAQAEDDANGAPNFQYILTTTEPPPDAFLESDHLVLKLDASEPGGRLFKRDF